MISKLKNLTQNQSVMKYVKNSSWMLAENGLKIISAIFVTIYMARYLGPEQFGVLSYALAIVAIFMAISRLGMESILVRDLAKYPRLSKAYMSTAFGLMFMAAMVNLVILSTLIYFLESNAQTKIYIWTIATGLLFQVFLVIDYNFQAQVKAKYSSIAKSVALAASAAVKIYLVLIQADLQAFAIAYAFDQFIIAIMLIVMHLVEKQQGFVFDFDSSLIKPLLKSAWPLILASLATILYMRIDQIMIKHILDVYQLGLYSAATKVYEGWIIIPFVISMSLLPAVVRARENSKERYHQGLKSLFALVFWGSILVALFVSIFGSKLIVITFGDEYKEAGLSLIIIMWASAFAALGFISARYLTVEGLEGKIFIRTLVALVLNIFLNFVLIPLYGIEGAAISTLISIIVSSYLLDYFDPKLKRQLEMKNLALFGPLRWKNV
jgi:O-antigen/teichoic acid export membrane protein